MAASLALLAALPHLVLLLASIPFVLSLPSGTNKPISLCLVASLFTGLLSSDPERAFLAWLIGMLIAGLALHERFRQI